MAASDRTPLIAGIAQLEQREDDPLAAREPLELMVEAVERAAQDAGSRALLGRAQSVRVIRGMWRYGDPARVVAQRIGAPGAQTVGTPYGGNMVQSALNQSALAIERGELDVIVLTGAECGNTQRKARAAKRKLEWSEAPGEPDLWLGVDKDMFHDAERARGIQAPIQIYPMFENALRHARGESIEDQLLRISELWAGLNAVAVDNPHAWIREPLSAEAIRREGPTNRPVSFPYLKLLNSNNAVDQAAALILCSRAVARELGLDERRFVYPHSGTDAHDAITASTRRSFHESPAIRIAGNRALELAGVSVRELGHIDVYSCFPSAVEVAMQELGLDRSRPLTVTGGLTFGGGPLNNYVMHAIARMAEVLRDHPGEKGLVTANGGYLSKHAFGVYSTEPPASGFQYADLQAEVDKVPLREAVVDHLGEAEIESYTVMYGPDGPAIAHASCLLPDGRRTWANNPDSAFAEAMTREEFCGRSARIDGQGGFQVL